MYFSLYSSRYYHREACQRSQHLSDRLYPLESPKQIPSKLRGDLLLLLLGDCRVCSPNNTFRMEIHQLSVRVSVLELTALCTVPVNTELAGRAVNIFLTDAECVRNSPTNNAFRMEMLIFSEYHNNYFQSEWRCSRSLYISRYDSKVCLRTHRPWCTQARRVCNIFRLQK